jgi:hypothetical protein
MTMFSVNCSEGAVCPFNPSIYYVQTRKPAGSQDMGRKTILVGFALFGYVLGFLAWLVRGSVTSLIESIGLNQDLAGAILAGIAGGFVMVIAVLVWAAVD